MKFEGDWDDVWANGFFSRLPWTKYLAKSKKLRKIREDWKTWRFGILELWNRVTKLRYAKWRHTLSY